MSPIRKVWSRRVATRRVLLAGVLSLAFLAAGAGASSTRAATACSSIQDVRIGHSPFFDHQWFFVAHQLGWDKQMCLNFKLTTFAQTGPAVSAFVHGSIDIIEGCPVCNFPFYKSVPQLTSFLNEDQFKGFLFVGRKGGKLKTYAQFLKKYGSPEKAKRATLLQLKGTTWPMYEANYKATVGGALAQVGLSINDVKIINFGDDEKAALAFISGTGDAYTGSLPEETRMIVDLKSRFVNLGGSEILGPAGLWYSTAAASRGWIAQHKGAVLKMIALSYRYNRYVQQCPSKVMPLVAKEMTHLTGASYSVQTTQGTMTKLESYRTYQQEEQTTYNPKSPLYWRNSLNYYVKQSIKQGTFPASGNYLNQNSQETLFKAFLKQPNLLKFVNSPLGC